ncbi:MAG TPA: hypothetical protein PK514_00280 [Spirochaetota bacterium]|nr:hypothetical protein [Spirochaetota bacterium]
MKKFIIILITVFSATSIMASEFEELDKPPEGAHEGQMLLGGFISAGLPFGDLITAEDDFLVGNWYMLSSDTMKELIVNHLAFDFGISFEYMPIDHVGAKSKLRYTTVVQRTAFGQENENWNQALFNSYSILLGPSFHLTVRKQWDVTFTPEFGYGFGQYEATPIASKLAYNYNNDGIRNFSGFIFGSELNLTIYFSGGVYISLGSEYTYYPISFSPANSLTQSTGSDATANGNGRTYSTSSGGSLQTVNLTLSVGYAFSN